MSTKEVLVVKWHAAGNGTFVNETRDRVADTDLPSPVSVAANTTYVASYYAPVGRYAYTQNSSRPPWSRRH